MMPQTWLRWGPMRAAIFAFVVAVFVVLYSFVRALQVSELPGAEPPVLPNPASLAAPPLPPLVNVHAVISQDAFDISRVAPTNRFLLPSEMPEPEAPAAALPRLVVLGIALADGGRSFATCQVGAERPMIVRVGDKIGPYTIRAIESKRVVIVLPTGAVETISALNTGFGN